MSKKKYVFGATFLVLALGGILVGYCNTPRCSPRWWVAYRNDPEFLEEVACESTDSRTALIATCRIHDQKRLGRIAQRSRAPMLAIQMLDPNDKNAARSIIDIAANSGREGQILMIRKMGDIALEGHRKAQYQRALARLALNDPSQYVRGIVLLVLEDQNALYKVATSETENPNLRAYAGTKLTGPSHLSFIAQKEPIAGYRIQALNKLMNCRVLEDIVRSDPHDGVRLAAKNRLKQLRQK